MEVPRKLVLDTDVLVDHLRGKKVSSLILSLQEKSTLAVTTVNLFELYYSAHRILKPAGSLAAVKGLASALEVLDLDGPSAERAGEVLAQLNREGKTLDARDLFIGCVALSNGFAVLTSNVGHLGRIAGLHVLSPSDLG